MPRGMLRHDRDRFGRGVRRARERQLHDREVSVYRRDGELLHPSAQGCKLLGAGARPRRLSQTVRVHACYLGVYPCRPRTGFRAQRLVTSHPLPRRCSAAASRRLRRRTRASAPPMEGVFWTEDSQWRGSHLRHTRPSRLLLQYLLPDTVSALAGPVAGATG